MSRLRLADPDYNSWNRSPLSECLIQLVATPDLPLQTRSEPVPEQQYRDWQERWASQQELITRRLSMIEEELDRLAEDRVTFPQLSLLDGVSCSVPLDDQLTIAE